MLISTAATLAASCKSSRPASLAHLFMLLPMYSLFHSRRRCCFAFCLLEKEIRPGVVGKEVRAMRRRAVFGGVM